MLSKSAGKVTKLLEQKTLQQISAPAQELFDRAFARMGDLCAEVLHKARKLPEHTAYVVKEGKKQALKHVEEHEAITQSIKKDQLVQEAEKLAQEAEKLYKKAGHDVRLSIPKIESAESSVQASWGAKMSARLKAKATQKVASEVSEVIDNSKTAIKALKWVAKKAALFATFDSICYAVGHQMGENAPDFIKKNDKIMNDIENDRKRDKVDFNKFIEQSRKDAEEVILELEDLFIEAPNKSINDEIVRSNGTISQSATLQEILSEDNLNYLDDLLADSNFAKKVIIGTTHAIKKIYPEYQVQSIAYMYKLTHNMIYKVTRYTLNDCLENILQYQKIHGNEPNKEKLNEMYEVVEKSIEKIATEVVKEQSQIDEANKFSSKYGRGKEGQGVQR